jgi:hypothetical protein
MCGGGREKLPKMPAGRREDRRDKPWLMSAAQPRSEKVKLSKVLREPPSVSGDVPELLAR